jgi:hypothetical protein
MRTCAIIHLLHLELETAHNRTADEARSNYPVVGDSRPHWQSPVRVETVVTENEMIE